MREVIPLMGLLSEFSKVFGIIKKTLDMKCSVFEDNNSCLALAKAPRMNPKTKFIFLKYHHFCGYVQNKTVDILPIDTTEQIADIFTKSLLDVQFQYLQKKLSGW